MSDPCSVRINHTKEQQKLYLLMWCSFNRHATNKNTSLKVPFTCTFCLFIFINKLKILRIYRNFSQHKDELRLTVTPRAEVGCVWDALKYKHGPTGASRVDIPKDF